MLENLESSYNCANANVDLPALLQELERWNGISGLTTEEQEEKNRLENQIHYIRSKCDIPGGGNNP